MTKSDLRYKYSYPIMTSMVRRLSFDDIHRGLEFTYKIIPNKRTRTKRGYGPMTKQHLTRRDYQNLGFLTRWSKTYHRRSERKLEKLSALARKCLGFDDITQKMIERVETILTSDNSCVILPPLSTSISDPLLQYKNLSTCQRLRMRDLSYDSSSTESTDSSCCLMSEDYTAIYKKLKLYFKRKGLYKNCRNP